ncbi:C2 calcium-dependent domain-containing protein 4C [Acipenser ruthenus]|uniref:C2 calcium-dependent domain-containing protein 4C n=1 Tax=Acipenser ruthenus TaxID=7906 RepID=A0A444UTI1_ACIRT|nr:C2 calcium-dependent domain-containing protein 4C [Acipenser ruthenus]
MWMLEKIRGSVEENILRQGESADKQGKAPVYSNVLTPDKIPDFFIPPKLTCIPTEPEVPDVKPKSNLKPSSSEQNVSTRKPPSSPRLMSKLAGDTKNLLRAANRHIIQIESADELVDGDSGDLNTNADPQAQTAMSLPYIPKTQTSYGFATLMESPHTRRKESLFHSDHTSPVQSPSSPRKKSTAKVNGESHHLNTPDFNISLVNPYRYFSGGESDTCSSAESSPFNSPLLSRSASLLKIFSHEAQSKVAKAKHPFARHSSLSTDDGSDLQHCQERLLKEHTVNLHKGGTARLYAEYDAGSARLRIRVIAAEDLYDKHFDIKSINCCVALYLNPGKLQKQRSTIIKNSRNPVFNEDFFFDGVPSVQIKNLSLKLKVVNKGTSLKRDTLLGERELPLAKLLSGL